MKEESKIINDELLESVTGGSEKSSVELAKDLNLMLGKYIRELSDNSYKVLMEIKYYFVDVADDNDVREAVLLTKGLLDSIPSISARVDVKNQFLLIERSLNM